MMAEILEPAMSELRRLCEREYPWEACGALLGKGDGERGPWQVTRALCTPNCHGEDRLRHYQLSPEHLLVAERQAQEADESVLGYFHSHPDCPAQPSEDDRAHAWPGYLYVICSVARARVLDLAAFTMVDRGGLFQRVPISTIGPIQQPPLEMPSWPSRS
jgi:proteasome lid subunit RPN8/RPN11